MFSVHFTRQGSISIELLPKREWFNPAFVILTIHPSIIGSMSVFRLKRPAQGHWLHIDDEKTYTAPLSLQKTEEARFTWLPQLLSFHDFAPSHFFLSECLKRKQEGKNSGPRTRWSPRWDELSRRSRFECFPKGLNKDSEIALVHRKWGRISLREYPWVDEPSLPVREIAQYRKDFWTTLHFLNLKTPPRACSSSFAQWFRSRWNMKWQEG
jgi:hypothetical protein